MSYRISAAGRAWIGCVLVILLFGYIDSAKAQDRSFRIASFTLNGEAVKDYSVAFQLNGKTIFPHRADNTIFVPKDIAEAEDVSLVFETSGFHFAFPSRQPGYAKSDDLKVDFALEIDTPPFDTKHGPAKKLRKICVIYSLTGVILSAPANLIVDPITTEIWTRCP